MFGDGRLYIAGAAMDGLGRRSARLDSTFGKEE